jgi:uncharacterized damage-inducible protein DinB
MGFLLKLKYQIMTKDDLNPDEFNAYYSTYINKTDGLSLSGDLKSSGEKTISFLKSIPLDKLEYRYSEGKWTIKEIIQHLMDAERIFAYRALRIARNDKTPLPGFEHDDYVLPSQANKRSIEDLIYEFKAIKLATVSLFDSFSDEMLLSLGMASNSPISVRAIGFIIMGHEIHHCEVIKNRYLK